MAPGFVFVPRTSGIRAFAPPQSSVKEWLAVGVHDFFEIVVFSHADLTTSVKNQKPLNQNLCELVPDIPPGALSLRWTLRDDYYHHHHSRMRLPDCPLYLELSWRPTTDERVHFVGIFRLNLAGLLREGYIRSEPKNSDGSRVRLRVFRADDGNFYIQTNSRERGLLIA